MRIAIVGLGHLGAVTAGCLASVGHEVVGIDRDRAKVTAMNKGHAPVDESGLERLIRSAWHKGRISGFDIVSPNILDRDLILICVDTPPAKGSLALKNVVGICAQLCDLGRDGKKVPPVVIRSTLPPGAHNASLAQFCSPRGNLRMTYNPEFGREGNAVADFMSPGRIVIGVHDRRDASQLRRLYKPIKADVFVTAWHNAEILKCAENTFHALKVSFANEVASVCEPFGADGKEVMALLCADSRLNISSAYLRPGLPFGGPCLDKDLRALITSAQQQKINAPLLRAIPQSNRQHFDRIVKGIKKKRSRVGFLGLSHKAGVSDYRGSHLLELARRLQAEGLEVRAADRTIGKRGESLDQVSSSVASRSAKDVRRDSDIVFAPQR